MKNKLNIAWRAILRRKALTIGVVLVLCVIVGAGFAFADNFLDLLVDRLVIDPNAYYPIGRVVDGDTFEVNILGDGRNSGSRIITIRVLGINTPETVDPRRGVECYGPEASAEAKRVLNDHKVRLAFSPNRELKDKYGRYLAYAYLDNGLFYNEHMIEEGYAKEYTYGTAYSMQKEFRSIQAESKKANKGLWGTCAKLPKS
jgi:micrococcal nuclease